MNKWRTYSLYFLIIVYISGAIGVVYKPNFFLPFTPFTLLYTCFVFLCYQPIKDFKFLMSFIGIALFGFISEVIGVKTGLIFGSYHYGNTLGFKTFEVPVTISINWALLTTTSILTTTYFIKNKWLISIVSALIATSIDYLIEQLAVSLDFWHFSGGIAGLHNYIGWFIISFCVSMIFQEILIKGNKLISLIILSLQLFFFGVIFIINN